MKVLKRSTEQKQHQVKIVFRYKDHRKIILPMGSSKMILDFDEILYVESDSNYSKIFAKSTSYVISKTLKWVEEQLDHQFSRIHKSYLINLKEVSSMSPREQSVTLTTGKELPISRSRKSAVTSFFEYSL